MNQIFERIGPLLSSIVSSVLLWTGPKVSQIVTSPLFVDLREVIGVLLALVTIIWMVVQISEKIHKKKVKSGDKK